MKKKEHRSLEEILNSLKDAEKEFDEKLDKYGMKAVKPKKGEEQPQEGQGDNTADDQNTNTEENHTEDQNSSPDEPINQ